MNQRILGIIPARGGSKSVPKKNIYPLGGAPLLSYMLTAALGSKILSRVVVSSDDDEILGVAERYGGPDVVLRRPRELAEDASPDVPMLQHAVRVVEEQEELRYDYIVQLHATTPFFTSDDIDSALALLIESNADSVVSVFQDNDLHPKKMKRIVDGRLQQYVPEVPEEVTSRRQDVDPVFKRNAGLYASKRHILMEQGRVWGEECLPHIMPRERSVDVNDHFDFVVAEAVLAHLREKGLF